MVIMPQRPERPPPKARFGVSLDKTRAARAAEIGYAHGFPSFSAVVDAALRAYIAQYESDGGQP